MRFVLKGPNVPNHLLSAHEKGEVVFFCGAGISMREPTKLPSFRGLVESLFKECNHASEWETREDDDPFDESLAWLESTVTGGREFNKFRFVVRSFGMVSPLAYVKQ